MTETYQCAHTVLNEFLKQITDLNETWCNQHWITSNKFGTTKCRKNASCILFVFYEITMSRNYYLYILPFRWLWNAMTIVYKSDALKHRDLVQTRNCG